MMETGESTAASGLIIAVVFVCWLFSDNKTKIFIVIISQNIFSRYSRLTFVCFLIPKVCCSDLVCVTAAKFF